MEEGKDDWDLLKKVRKVEPIDEGLDSAVFSVSSENDNGAKTIAKMYDRYRFNTIDPRHREEVLKQYYADTEEAKKFLEENPNPRNQSIEINGEIFPLHYQAVSQGSLMLEGAKAANLPWHNTGKNKILTQSLVGQKFIGGSNLFDLMHEGVRKYTGVKSTSTETQQVFLNNDVLCTNLEIIIRDFFSFLSEALNAHLGYNSINVKPFLNKKEKRIEIVITDLCASLRNYYEHSEKFEELRRQR